MAKNNNTLLYVLIGLLIISVLLNFYYMYSNNKTDNLQLPQPQPPSPPPQEPKETPKPKIPPSVYLVLFHSEGCGHCTHMMPAWKEVSERLKEMGMNVIDLEYMKNKEQVGAANVRGFPTIRLYLNGFPSEQFIEYKGDRSAESIWKFAMSGGREV